MMGEDETGRWIIEKGRGSDVCHASVSDNERESEKEGGGVEKKAGGRERERERERESKKRQLDPVELLIVEAGVTDWPPLKPLSGGSEPGDEGVHRSLEEVTCSPDKIVPQSADLTLKNAAGRDTQ